MKIPHNKVFISKEVIKKIRNLFCKKQEMSDICKATGLTERVVRRVINDNGMKSVRGRYLSMAANKCSRDGISYAAMAKSTGLPYFTLSDFARKMKIKRPKMQAWNKRVSDSQKSIFAEMYKGGKTAEEIAVLHGFKTGKTVCDALREFGIERRPSKIQTHYNESFFEDIDTHNKAYILGLFMSDGYVLGDYRGIGIQLTKRDAYILRKISTLLGPSTKVNKINCSTKRKTVPNAKDMVRLTVHSRKMAEGAKAFGLIRKKSKILRYRPIAKGLLSSYFRGLLDGDGCIGVYDGRLQIQISTASKKFAEDLCSLDEGWFRIHRSSSKNKKTGKTQRMYNLYVWGGESARIRFVKWIYSNKGDLYLRRKYAKVQGKII